MNNLTALVIGLIVGAVGAGGYMYSNLQTEVRNRATAEQATQAATARHKDLEARITAIESAKTTAEKSAENLKAEIARLTSDKAGVAAAMANMETALKTAQAEAAETRTRIGDLSSKLAAVEAARTSAEGARDSATAESSRLKTEIAAARSSLATAEQQLAGLRDQLGQANAARVAAEKALAAVPKPQ